MANVTAMAWVAVGVGAAFGAWTRWLLGIWLNAALPHLPLGTLVANVAGGYLIGVAVAYFAGAAHLAPEWRLIAITGFLGSLTTFSTFSAESVQLLMTGRYGWAIAHSGVHLAGSLVATGLGIATMRAVQG